MSLDDHRPPEYRQLITEEQLLHFTERFLAHLGTFAIGGAMAVGVFSDEVHDRVCYLTSTAIEGNPSACDYLAGLSYDMQMGLAGIAVVVLLTSEWMNRRRHAREDENA